MRILLVITLDLALLALMIGYIWYCIDSLLNRLPYRIGYVSSDLRSCVPTVTKIIRTYVPDTTQVSYIEPGSGLSHMARHLAHTFTWKEVVAIDTSRTLLGMARLLCLWQKIPVRFLHENAFSFTYPPNSCIYCYLTTPILERMYNEKKLSGCLVISLTFPIPHVKATEEIALTGWQERILVYDFRTA